MLKTMILSVLTLTLAGTPTAAPEWAWIEVDPDGTTWKTGGGSADVVLDGAHFEATLFDQSGAKLSILKGRADGDVITGVDPYSPTTGQNERGLGPSLAGRRLEIFPQTSVVEGTPPPEPKRLHESIVLTSMDRFVGFTRK